MCYQITAMLKDELGTLLNGDSLLEYTAPLQTFQGCLRWEISVYCLFAYTWWFNEYVCK